MESSQSLEDSCPGRVEKERAHTDSHSVYDMKYATHMSIML